MFAGARWQSDVCAQRLVRYLHGRRRWLTCFIVSHGVVFVTSQCLQVLDMVER